VWKRQRVHEYIDSGRNVRAYGQCGGDQVGECLCNGFDAQRHGNGVCHREPHDTRGYLLGQRERNERHGDEPERNGNSIGRRVCRGQRLGVGDSVRFTERWS